MMRDQYSAMHLGFNELVGTTPEGGPLGQQWREMKTTPIIISPSAAIARSLHDQSRPVNQFHHFNLIERSSAPGDNDAAIAA